MLFKPEHRPMILEGRKTATRRSWKTPRVKVGGIYKAKLQMLSKEYFTRIKVTKLYQQKLGNMTLEDVKKEGYDTHAAFKEIWIKINGSWDPELRPYVIEFELEGN
jgi:hypothetical protein